MFPTTTSMTNVDPAKTSPSTASPSTAVLAATAITTGLPPTRARPQGGLTVHWMGKEEEELVLDVVRRKEPFRYYGLGQTPPPMASTLETEFAAMMGTTYALAVSSGTAALEVALGALGVGPGDEVILPAYSWISCFTAIVRLGALPVLAEIDETLCLAPGEIKRLSNWRTKAALIVHYQGIAADMEPLLAEARECGIKVLEDCAESAGALYRGQRVGSLGDIGIYSFQAQKSMTCGEGGMVVTSDPLLYERAVRMHDIGNLRPYHRQLVDAQIPAFCGSQFRMSELQAAVALAQLRKLDRMRDHCRRLQAQVLSKLQPLTGSHSGFDMRRVPDPEGDSGIEIYLLMRDGQAAARLRKMLEACNVNCQKTTGTCPHYHQDYCKMAQAISTSASPFLGFEVWPTPGYREQDFPRTEAIVERAVALPLGVLYTVEDADYIADCVLYAVREGQLGVDDG